MTLTYVADDEVLSDESVKVLSEDSRPIATRVTETHCHDDKRDYLGSEARGKPKAEAESISSKFALYRPLVPLLAQKGLTYLNAASAPPSNLIVHEAIVRYASEALYDARPYPDWVARTRKARSLIARCINAGDVSDVAFTRDTTEGIGDFIRSIRFERGDNVVLLDNEYPHQVYGWMALREKYGLEIRRVPTVERLERTGKAAIATAETFRPFVDERTRAIGISSVMFDTGQHNDVAGISAAFRPRGIHVLADIAQHVGFLRVDVRALGVSAAAFTLHKGLNSPIGIAALYIDPAAIADLDPIPPIVSASGVANAHPELPVPFDDPIVFHPNALRFEHQNLSLLGAAAAEAFTRFYLDTLGPADVEEHLQTLGDMLFERCDEIGVHLVTPRRREERAGHLYTLDLRGKEWVDYLTGHGIRMTANRLGIRVSFGFYSNEHDVERLLEVLKSGLATGLPVVKR